MKSSDGAAHVLLFIVAFLAALKDSGADPDHTAVYGGGRAKSFHYLSTRHASHNFNHPSFTQLESIVYQLCTIHFPTQSNNDIIAY